MKKSVTEFIASYEKFSEDLANVFAPEGVYESLRQREATEKENMVRAEEERRKAKEEEERLAKIRAEGEVRRRQFKLLRLYPAAVTLYTTLTHRFAHRG